MLRTVFLVAAAPVLFTACSGSNNGLDGNGNGNGNGDGGASPDGSPPLTSGLPESAEVASISQDDLTQLCDWAISYEGGPGAALACGTVNEPSECINTILAAVDCATTVAQLEKCVYAVKADSCTAVGTLACLPATCLLE
jgi:hypothetical protein